MYSHDLVVRHWRIMLEKVADSARKAVKLAEPYKPYGGQFLEFCSISLSIISNMHETYQKKYRILPIFLLVFFQPCCYPQSTGNLWPGTRGTWMQLMGSFLALVPVVVRLTHSPPPLGAASAARVYRGLPGVSGRREFPSGTDTIIYFFTFTFIIRKCLLVVII